MNLKIYRDKRNTGKFYHKVPFNTGSTSIKYEVLREITKYIEQNNDFGEINYIPLESRILKLNPHTTYTYEDLY